MGQAIEYDCRSGNLICIQIPGSEQLPGATIVTFPSSARPRKLGLNRSLSFSYPVIVCIVRMCLLAFPSNCLLSSDFTCMQIPLCTVRSGEPESLERQSDAIAVRSCTPCGNSGTSLSLLPEVMKENEGGKSSPCQFGSILRERQPNLPSEVGG